LIEGLRHLLDLQHLDDELIAAEEEHAAVPVRREGMAEARRAGEERLAGLRQALEDAELAQRRAEQELQDQEALLRKLEGQQFQVKTNEAYTALLHEMDAARQAISDCETRILESMETIEVAKGALGSGERGVREEVGRLEAEERALGAREQQLEAELSELRARRAELCGLVPRDLLERYERIAARRRPVVVLVKKELCEGCRVDIPPQDYIEILRGERIVACGRCQRILVHAEKLAAPGPP
jgi:predicted  nucleic acid-binding Zn-ribbon protein